MVLAGKFAIAVDVISRHVRAHVDIDAERRNAPIAWFADSEQGAGLRVALAKTQESVGMALRNYRQVRLRVITAETCRWQAVLPAAYFVPQLKRCHQNLA
jgi:hypothetical protein